MTTKYVALDESHRKNVNGEESNRAKIISKSGEMKEKRLSRTSHSKDDYEEAVRPGQPRSVTEVETLNNRAIRLASLGKEEEAIQFYFRSLRLLKIDLGAISTKLDDNPDDERWRTEWLIVAAKIAEIRTAIAILYERLGAYNKAISSCKEAREIYEGSPLTLNNDGIPAREVETGLRQMDMMLERLNTAKGSYVARKNLHQEAIEVRKLILTTRNSAKLDDLYRKAFVLLTGVLSMEKECLGETHPQVADTLQIISRTHKERGEIKDAIKQMNTSLLILKLCLGPHHPRTGITFQELAKLYDERSATIGDIDMAVGLYAQATTSFRQCYGEKDVMVGASLNNEAVLHIKQSNYDLAVEKLSDALIAYESSTMHKDKSINTDSSQVWKNLGECYTRRNEYESAHFALNNALEVQKDARLQAEKAGKPVSAGCSDASLADTLLRLGNATKLTLRYEDAHQIYKEALLIYRLHYASAHRASNGRVSDALSDAQDRLAHTLYCIAEVQEIRGIYEDARSLFSESLQLRLTSDAQREKDRMNMLHCAMALAGIGSCHVKVSEFDDAASSYKESLRYLEAHGVPPDHELKMKLSKCLEEAQKGLTSENMLSDESPGMDSASEMDIESKRLMDEGQFDEAIEILEKALAIRRRRLTNRLKEEIITESLEEREDVAMTLVNYAAILSKKGEVRQAEMLTREAIRMYKSNGYEESDHEVRCLQEQLEDLKDMHVL
mmetsp:Transcript_30683/g.46470  ORF Transcript_30683/g.46470 Transcript_30683/m.46470 type:complete len:727 (-) Transcript_30683:1506-3686(-)|eukprot:CAMPEP_0178917796 /NCGR_PEP_ID=MMETSP0786-20121207/13451_1 /TAXON_ID=186022 /ORGANISM="Thalassionema frauenfeldii, Strain CCMP 1798" /LENGTH=726 /DNA_ID=CAMNT_0020591397 /DNA_START=346 /DNA_END=2526 /DNA_ORIENTATION=+